MQVLLKNMKLNVFRIIEDEKKKESSGNGPVDATFNAIKELNNTILN